MLKKRIRILVLLLVLMLVKDWQRLSLHGAFSDMQITGGGMSSMSVAELFIEGEPTDIGAYVVFSGHGEYQYTMIPFLSVLEKIGVKVNRVDIDKYSIVTDVSSFILDTTDCILSRQDQLQQRVNYFELPPDSLLSQSVFFVEHGVLYTDTETISGFLISIGWRIAIDTSLLHVDIYRKPRYSLPSI